MSEILIHCQNLGKTYHDGALSVKVLDSVNFAVAPGEKIAIIGPSGSGKSTLMHLLGGLDQPSSGKVCTLGQDWQKLSEKKRCQLRNKRLGFVYQFHHLLPEFTALENVAMPLLLAGQPQAEAFAAADRMLTEVGLAEREAHKPAQLSGGERQRVAIARALVHQPHCVLADEPTGNLDQVTAQRVFDLMLALNQRMNTALVIVTHDQQLAERMDRVLSLQGGDLTEI